MDLQLTLSIVSSILGIIGLIIGLFGIQKANSQFKERQRLAAFIRGQNWQLYSKTNNASGAVQKTIMIYKDSTDNIDSEVIEWLSKADAFCQDVFRDAIRQIQISEEKFNHEIIQKWVDEGRISEPHAKLFRNISSINET